MITTEDVPKRNRKYTYKQGIAPRLPVVSLSSLGLQSPGSPRSPVSQRSFSRATSPVHEAAPTSAAYLSLESQTSLLGFASREAIAASDDPRLKTLKGRIIAPYVGHDFAATYEGLNMIGPVCHFHDQEFENEYHNKTNEYFPQLLLQGFILGSLNLILSTLTMLLGMYLYLNTIYPAYYWAAGALEIANLLCVTTHLTMSRVQWPPLKNNIDIITFINLTLFSLSVNVASIVIMTHKSITAAPSSDYRAMVFAAFIVSFGNYLLTTGSGAGMFPCRVKILIFFLVLSTVGMMTVASFFGKSIEMLYHDTYFPATEFMAYINIFLWAALFLACRFMAELKDRIDFFQCTSARKKLERMANEKKLKNKDCSAKTGLEDILKWIGEAIQLVSIVEADMHTLHLQRAIGLMEDTVMKLYAADTFFELNIESMSNNDKDFARTLMAAFTRKPHSSLWESVIYDDVAYAQQRQRTLKLSSDSSSDLPRTGDAEISVLPVCRLADVLKGKVGRDWELNILDLARQHEHIMLEVGTAVLLDDLEQLSYDGPQFACFQRLFVALEEHYFDNPYHNATHGATVAHTALCMCRMLQLDKAQLFTSQTEVSVLLAALAHDVGHPGVNSSYFIQSMHSLAFLYNDMSVLENFHSAILFQLLGRCGTNVFEACGQECYMVSRETICELILATDMKYHAEATGKLNMRRLSPDFHYNTQKDFQLMLKMCLKAADLSHGALEWTQHIEWSMRVTEEFYKQGEVEYASGMPISMLCDRSQHQDMAKSQYGFLSYLIEPFFRTLAHIAKGNMSVCIDNLEHNIEKWNEYRKDKTSVVVIPDPIRAQRTHHLDQDVVPLVQFVTAAITLTKTPTTAQLKSRFHKNRAKPKTRTVEVQTELEDYGSDDDDQFPLNRPRGLSYALCTVREEDDPQDGGRCTG